MSRSPKKLNHEKTRRQGLNGTLMYTLSSGKISAVWYSGTLNSKNKRLFSIRHCTIYHICNINGWKFHFVGDC
jgi:hypothetical protein